MIRIRKAWLNLHVEVTCEGCGHCFDYVYTIRESGGGMSNVEGRVRKRYMQGEFGFQRCPKCKYLQSWMVEQWKERWTRVAIGLSAPLFFFVISIIGRPWPNRSLDGLGDLLVFALAIAGYVLLFMITAAPFVAAAQPLLKHPNRRWHKKNGPDVPPPGLPSVRTR